MKLITAILFIASAIVYSCGDPADDPKPQITALDSVKTALTGKWTFKSVTVTQLSSNKTATTSTCERTELAMAGFGNETWKSFAGPMSYEFHSNGKVTGSYCANLINDGLTWKVTELPNKTYQLEFIDLGSTSSPQGIFVSTASSIKSNEITAEFIGYWTVRTNDHGYKVVYKFVK